MAGRNDKRKNSWLDDQPYYMQSQQVMRRRDLETENKYKNKEYDKKRLEDKYKQFYTGKSWKGNKNGDAIQARNKNSNDFKDEAEYWKEYAKERKQGEIADKLLNNRRKKKGTER